jgi:hypothetical protein
MSQVCLALHSITKQLARHIFPFTDNGIPKNGIYMIFEKGEHGHGGDRIVRVGTHTGANQLRSRLKQHFIRENKDRSIFRKNIGRCLLNTENDPYLEIWELDCTSSEGKAKHAHLINPEHQKDIEIKVSEYIKSHFSFCVLEVQNKDERLYLESRLVSTVSGCKECGPSADWLGLSSPKEKIRESGLWQVNELYKEPLDEKDLVKVAGKSYE